MSNYTKSTDFASKDSLASGNAAKIVKGTEIDTEFNNIATAVATKADLASPTFTGTLTAGTASISALTATIVGGSISGITDLAITEGGTGASTAANARTNLGTVADTASNGIAVRTAANTLTARTITAGTGISVADGDGVAGNPTITNTGATSVDGRTGAVVTLVAASSQSASGSSVDFTSIPSWVKRITVVLDQVSYASGTNNGVIRIGSGSLATSGYVGSSTSIADTPTVTISSVTNGFGNLATSAAGTTMTGTFTITNITGNTWVCSGSYQRIGDARIQFMNFSVSLGGALDMLSLVATTSTFDAGTINILYE
jgi:hypothetical protein